MIIGLMGFECDSPNKGCEALGYSFISLVRNLIGSGTTFYVFTNDGLGLFPEYFHDCSFIKVPLRIKDPTFETWKAFRKCNMIFDVTLGDSFSDIYSVQQCISNIKFKLMAEVLGKSYYLLPQTYGPFEDKKCRILSKIIIAHSKYVFCRDSKSMDYIKKIGAHNNNSMLTTDMAFLLPYDKSLYEFDGKKTNVGINISGLLVKGGFTGANQFDMAFKYEDYIKKILDSFCSFQDVTVHLVPHVIDVAIDAHDDDYRYIEEIHRGYESTVLAPAFKSPIEAKSYISKLDFFIGSRMHSTIASFSSCVPTVPVSYSRKFEGLFDSIDYPYLVHGNTDSLDTAINNTMAWYAQREQLKKSILRSKSIVDKEICEFESQMSLIIKGGQL